MGNSFFQGAIIMATTLIIATSAETAATASISPDGVTLAEACRIFEENGFDSDSLPKGFHFCGAHIAVELDGTCTEATEAGQDDFLHGDLLWVAAYDTNRAYGGPEEGGWWFDCGTLITGKLYAEIGLLPSVHTHRSEARKARRAMQLALVPLNEGKREIDSVCCDGVFSAEIHEDFLPAHYPAQRPFYE
jgi:hypothetical protein